MTRHVRIVGIAAVLAVGIWLAADVGGAADDKAEGWKPILDESTSLKLIKRSLDTIQGELKGPRKDAKAVRLAAKRIQVHAVLIAAYAQSAKDGDSGQLAGYRDGAVKLAKAAADGEKPDKLKKLADALADAKPGKANAPGSLKTLLEDEGDMMMPFKLQSKGGDGIATPLQSSSKLMGKGGNGVEEKVRALARFRLKPARLKIEAEELALLGNKIAVLAQEAREWGPATKEGKKDPKDWRELSDEMRDGALDLAVAAKTGKVADVFAASKKLNSTCIRCHNIFKTK